MNTENLKTLKIHKLSQEQYERELLAGNVDPNALYLTPDDGDADSITVNLDGAVEGEANPINADTLNGRAASEYALKSDLENLPSGGVSSWNDLTDKPFEEIITISDTLTWDGNTEGLTFVPNVYFKVSDLTPSAEDIANGYTMKAASGYPLADDSSYFEMYNEFGVIAVPSNNTPYVLINPADQEGMPKGIYFTNYGNDWIASFTINGYNHFENKVIKTIEPKYLPEHLQLKEYIVETDTLTWDGDKSGLDSGYSSHFKVSDNVPTAEDLANGYEIIMSLDSEPITNIEDPLYTDEEGAIYLGNASGPGCALVLISPSKGIYFLNFQGAYVKSLKIPGYTFEIKETKLAKKYIPNDIGVSEEYVAEQIDILRQEILGGEW